MSVPYVEQRTQLWRLADMGFIFRKSINFGPFRINLSKNGVGMSMGVPGLRYTMGQKGNMLTASLPGTGLSYRINASKLERSEENEECQRADLAKIKALEASIAADLPCVIAGRRLQIAWLHYQANQCENALKELDQANWNHPDFVMSKAMILARMGRDSEALQCMDAIAPRASELGSYIKDYCGLLVYGFLEIETATPQDSPEHFSCDPEGYNVFRSWLQKDVKQPDPAIAAKPSAPKVRATHGKQFASLCSVLMAMVIIADGKVDEREFQYLQNRLASDPRFARYDNNWLLDLCRRELENPSEKGPLPVADLLSKISVDLLSAADKAEALQMALGMAQSDFKISPEEIAVMRQSAQILNAALPMGFDEMAEN